MYKSPNKLKRILLGLNNFFTLEEACTILDCMKGLNLNSDRNPKSLLIWELQCNLLCSLIEEKWNIDKKQLVNKIMASNYRQCHEIVLMVKEFWETVESQSNVYDLIKEIFVIS